MTAGPFYLDPDRILYEYKLGYGYLREQVCLVVYNKNCQKEEKRIKRSRNSFLRDVLDGGNLLFEHAILPPGFYCE